MNNNVFQFFYIFVFHIRLETYILFKMKKIEFTLCSLFAVMIISACSTVALTGRKQLMLVSDSEVMSLSNQSFKEYMATAKPSTNAANTAMVVRCGRRIANAVETFLKANGLSSEVQNFAWEFHLVKDSTANAFCMPGGKIVVNEGLLPYTQTEAALAVVLGHEVAHAVAKHSAERMSQQLIAQYGAQALSVLTSGQSSASQAIAQQVYGLGANYGVMLPYSRKNESEADHMGLIFAAMAGYNPEVAIPFWSRMASAGSNVPEFFSDHPSDASRIAKIKKEMTEALKYYKPTVTTKSSVKSTKRTKTSKRK
jgi:predicted Zn-dependent protease